MGNIVNFDTYNKRIEEHIKLVNDMKDYAMKMINDVLEIWKEEFTNDWSLRYESDDVLSIYQETIRIPGDEEDLVGSWYIKVSLIDPEEMLVNPGKAFDICIDLELDEEEICDFYIAGDDDGKIGHIDRIECVNCNQPEVLTDIEKANKVIDRINKLIASKDVINE